MISVFKRLQISGRDLSAFQCSFSGCYSNVTYKDHECDLITSRKPYVTHILMHGRLLHVTLLRALGHSDCENVALAPSSITSLIQFTIFHIGSGAAR